MTRPTRLIGAVQVTSAAFTGASWAACPFAPAPIPRWLLDACQEGAVVPHTRDGAGHAQWDVRTAHGLACARPGDWIEQHADGVLGVRKAA